jgi:voltage-gated potassium channel
MTSPSIDIVFGFGGMHPSENPRALKLAELFEPLMLMIAIWILIEWNLTSRGMITDDARLISDWIIWGFFLMDTAVLAAVADKPLRYLARNWAHLVIILLAVPVVFETLNRLDAARMLRLILLAGYFTHNFQSVRLILSKNKLGKTLLFFAFFITAAGITIATIDPAIKTPQDGIWWAWVTVTTVGYGDIVPQSAEGRFFASILIMVGIVMVSLITANLSAYLLSRGVQKELQYEQKELKKLAQLESKVSSLEDKMDRLLEHFQLPPASTDKDKTDQPR